MSLRNTIPTFRLLKKVNELVGFERWSIEDLRQALCNSGGSGEVINYIKRAKAEMGEHVQKKLSKKIEQVRCNKFRKGWRDRTEEIVKKHDILLDAFYDQVGKEDQNVNRRYKYDPDVKRCKLFS